MAPATPAATTDGKSTLSSLLRRLLAVPNGAFPHPTKPQPVRDAPRPDELAVLLTSPSDGAVLPLPAVKAGDKVEPGQPLGHAGAEPRWRAPVAAEVVDVRSTPDVRGGRPKPAVYLRPLHPSDDAPAFAPLDPTLASAEALLERLASAGVTNSVGGAASPLHSDIQGAKPGRWTVLAVDRDPSISVQTQLLRERSADVEKACGLLARLTQAPEIVVVAPHDLATDLATLATRAGSGKGPVVRVVSVEATYPNTHEALLGQRLGLAVRHMVTLEAALAALDAVARGIAQRSKVITVVGPKGRVAGNFRVAVGSRLSDVLDAAGLSAREGDKVVVGGAMRGHAQYALDAPVDAAVDGVIVLRRTEVLPYRDEPCINCGACVDVCPARLQVQRIGRFAEFGLFDRGRDLAVGACIECGVCASVCPARRPLVQLIRLTKTELAKASQGAQADTAPAAS